MAIPTSVPHDTPERRRRHSSAEWLAVRWRQASQLSAREWLDVLGAQSRLIRAQLCVMSGRVPSLTPLATGVTRVRHLDDRGPLRGESARTWERAEALARAVERATHYGVIRPRPRCLARSLALLHALRTAGIEGARLRIGSGRMESHTGGHIGPHAWIELNGRPIGDSHTHRPTAVAGVVR